MATKCATQINRDLLDILNSATLKMGQGHSRDNRSNVMMDQSTSYDANGNHVYCYVVTVG